jgi:hypothetical protein
MESANRLRQLGLFVHQFASDSNGTVRGVDIKLGPPRPTAFGGTSRDMEYSLFPEMLWTYVWPNGVHPQPAAGEAGPGSRVSLFVSPTDPGLPPQPRDDAQHSYPANAWLFAGHEVNLFTAAPDGLSNTIALAEHYRVCRNPNAPAGFQELRYDFYYHGPSDGSLAMNAHRPTFADGGPILGGRTEDDVYPVTTGFPPVTRPSRPGATFQLRPTPESCDPKLPQAHFPSGLLTGMGDGSVRTVRPGVSPEVFWGSVTPAGGEVAALD